MILSLIMALAAAHAQGAPPAPCRAAEVVVAEQAAAPGGRILYVGCGAAAVRIGRVDDYRSSYNVGLGTLAVVVREGPRTRVLVVRPAADGTIEIQEVSGDLAKQAGQPFNTGLRALEVDLGRFVVDGSIAASASGQPARARLTPDHYAPPAADKSGASPETTPPGRPQ